MFVFVKAVIHNTIEHLEGQIPIGLRVELFVVEQYVNKFFGYKCIVEEGVPTTSKMYYGGSDLDVSQCIFELNRHGVKTIYVTNENVVNKGQQIRGGTFLRCNTVIVEHTDYDETTVLHEVGHTLGLVHCDNLKCLMAINNDAEVTMDFCDKCKKRLIHSI